MKLLDLQQTADFLESATIEASTEMGHTLIHSGRTESGAQFVLVNCPTGMSALSESL